MAGQMTKPNQDVATTLEHASALLAMLGVTNQHSRSEISASMDRLNRAPFDVPTADRGAALARMPTQQYRRRVKACTGLTFGQHRRHAMINAAIRALAVRENLTGAALGSGFSSSAHFSSAVRTMFGLAPSTLLRSDVRIVACSGDEPQTAGTRKKSRIG